MKQNGGVLKYVHNQTPKICLEAVKENGRALQYVENQTPKLCLEAIKQNGEALEYVKDQSEEICLEAVKQQGWALNYVENQTKEMDLINRSLRHYKLESYREIRSRLASGEMEPKDSPYHVLEQLNAY